MSTSTTNNTNTTTSHPCVICTKMCPTSAATCSLRCDWSKKSACVQCGRERKVSNQTGTFFHKSFCGPNCHDEARRGNWCVGCGIRQVPQGFPRCSDECMAEATANTSDNNSGCFLPPTTNNNQINNAADDSPYPSRKVSPNDGMKRGVAQRTISTVEPGSKIWERIVTPFGRYGQSVHQVLQIHTAPSDKKAYNANRLAVDQRLSQNRIQKYQWGGEGGELKRFVPLLAGCSTHLHHGARSDQDGNATVCADPSCDVCRVASSGMKLSAMAGRNSHFSLPTLETCLPWCKDASSTTPDGSTVFSAVALVRVVVGNPYMVNELSQVCPPPIGYDSVVLRDGRDEQNGTDSCFSYTDYSLQPEYIVLFSQIAGAATSAPPPPAAAPGGYAANNNQQFF